MKRFAVLASLLIAACVTEDDGDTGDETANPTGASSAGPTTDPTGSGETGDDSGENDPTSSGEDGESSGGAPETSAGGESTGGSPDSGGSGACESFDDMTPYYGDVQVDSFCWTAGLYYACGETAAGDETCAILGGFATDGGAACPYC